VVPYPLTDPDACATDLSNSGATWVFLGSASGLATDPAFVLYGPEAGEELDVVVSGFDANGDGRDDILVGSDDALDNGVALLALGRAEDAGDVRVLCPEWTLVGVHDSSEFGRAMAALGDVDGDGCDEVAIGAADDDLGVIDQGSVRVIWGTGRPGCGAAEVTTLGSYDNYTRVGDAVAGGGDLDGDGVPDLAAGAYSLDQPGGESGAIYWVSGSLLAGLGRNSLVGGLPPDANTLVHDLTVNGVRRLATGAAHQLGRGVAFVDDPSQPGHSLIAGGLRFGDIGGVDRAGGVVLYGWDAATHSLTLDPVMLIGGETLSPDGELGRALYGDGDWLLIGARRSNTAGVDQGAVYPLHLTP
jgi:hypothetical protein